MISNEAPYVSVVVPAHNAGATITDCVTSLLALDYPAQRLEYILVDNVSQDDTGRLLRRFGDAVRVLHEPVRGSGAARNRGIRAAEGGIVAMTDADCVVDKGWLRALAPALVDPMVGAAGGCVTAWSPRNRIAVYGDRIHDHDQAINQSRPPYLMGANWASRRDVLQQVGLFDASFLRQQDVDLSFRILQAGYRFTYVASAIVRHRNQETLRGLWAEGFRHGLHSVKTLKQHGTMLNRYGFRRFHWRSWLKIGRSSLTMWREGQPVDALCHLVFNAGKKAGKLAGSVRYGYPTL